VTVNPTPAAIAAAAETSQNANRAQQAANKGDIKTVKLQLNNAMKNVKPRLSRNSFGASTRRLKFGPQQTRRIPRGRAK
jgi:hypothetical protein